MMQIDFHAHILPGADHGSDGLATSLRQISLAREAGIDLLIATPHFYPRHEALGPFLARRAETYACLTEALPADAPRIRLGAEVQLCRGLNHMHGLEQLCAAAAWLLPDGGRFALVHRPERLCDLIFQMRSHRIEPKRIRFVRHTAASPVCLVLLEGRRGGRPGLSYEPDFIEFLPDGTETDAYRAAYHRKGAEP